MEHECSISRACTGKTFPCLKSASVSGVFKFMWATFRYRTTNSTELKMKNVLLKKCIIIESLRKPSFYTNSIKKLYQVCPTGFLPLWKKGQRVTTRDNCSCTGVLCYLLFLFLNPTRISILKQNQMYQSKSFPSGTLQQYLLYMTKHDWSLNI